MKVVIMLTITEMKIILKKKMKIKIDPEVAAVIKYLSQGAIEDGGRSPQDAYTKLVNGMLLKQIRRIYLNW